jgi:hypothetical protein
MIETIDSLRLKTKTEFIQILRWEDDGGAMYDIDIPLSQVAENNTPQSRDGAANNLFYSELKNSQSKGNGK